MSGPDRTATVSSSFSSSSVVFLSQSQVFSTMMKWGCVAGGMGEVNVKKVKSSSLSLRWKVKKVWRKGKYEKAGRPGLSTSYSLSVSRTAENLSSIDYRDVMFQSAPLPSLSLPLPRSVSFPPPPCVCLARAQCKCAKQRKQSVTEHFSVLLMLQLFLAWFDNINCCPQCYWWGDPEPVLLSPDQASGRAKTRRTCPDPVGQGLLSISSCIWGKRYRSGQLE